ncbi:hypothetical protein KPC83_00845 [Collinsella sp. zg1085]|uniref:hypothetical protein n=1 Tax=Collinsella sp. zg1085 TaxID=2844380 RepID=UPI001C0BD86E|nr:hypothetical protein [Collinsella sp. zg1085]QWT17745.1 hypothetical protein KPC83_00845 [Collinsella sp. zg1085]
MPSWNIHIAQTEAVLERASSLARFIRDQNAFLFGNVVPDIMVGYMVPGIEEPLPYRVTHFANSEPIPKPREQEFWELYVAPLLQRVPACNECDVVPMGSIAAETASVVERVRAAEMRRGPEICCGCACAEVQPVSDVSGLLPALSSGVGVISSQLLSNMVMRVSPVNEVQLQCSVLDLTLGAWAHLLADKLWNLRVNEFLDVRGDRPNDQFRRKKQADFDMFGKTLHIDAFPQVTERLLQAAAHFPQYSIDGVHSIAAVGVAHETVRANELLQTEPNYCMLDARFFEQTFFEVVETTEQLFAERLNVLDVSVTPAVAS